MKPINMNSRLAPVAAARVLIAAAFCWGAATLNAQIFNTGSDGSLGDVVISENTTVPLPPDGRLQYKSLTVNSGARLNFTRNIRNTPVFILSQADVIVDGIIDVNGSSASGPTGGIAGPGGFDGGKPGFGVEVGPGNGYGPGGALGGPNQCDANGAGGGAYGTAGSGKTGATYGNVTLIPLVGGSGGGGGAGQPGGGGGGGGGAILIASNTRIAISGTVESRGGGAQTCLNGGSGGAIRLLAPKVEGSGIIDVRQGGSGGDGRIRVDAIDKVGIRFAFRDNSVTTIGGNMLVAPPVLGRLDTVEVAGNAIPLGSAPLTFTLPFGSNPQSTVKIQARDFGRVVPIRVVLTPDSGVPIIADAEIDNLAANPAVVAVPVTIPVNTPVIVHCWTR